LLAGTRPENRGLRVVCSPHEEKERASFQRYVKGLRCADLPRRGSWGTEAKQNLKRREDSSQRASGARGECRETRSQDQNKKIAFRRMAETKTFQLWVKRQLWKHPEPPEKRVEKDMDPRNLLIMGREDDRWKVID
jgi:hypothetical protein